MPDWIWIAILMAILLGPIFWALTFGARGGAPKGEDARGGTAYDPAAAELKNDVTNVSTREPRHRA